MFTKRQFLTVLFLAIALCVAFTIYSFYEKTETELSATTAELQATQKSLSELQASTTAALQSETALIASQSTALKQSQ